MNRYVLIFWNMLLSIVVVGLVLRVSDVVQRLSDINARLTVRLDYLYVFVDEGDDLLQLLREIVYDIHVAGGG